DRRGEGAEQNRGEKEASAAREGAAEEEALDAAVQVAEIAQAPAGLVERKGRAGGHAGTAPDFISGGLSRLGGGRRVWPPSCPGARGRRPRPRGARPRVSP